MITLFDTIVHVADESRPLTPINLQLPAGISGIVNSIGNLISIVDPGVRAFYKVISKLNALYSRTLVSEKEKVFILIFPVAPITIRPVVIFSIMYSESYVSISNDADGVDVDGFLRYKSLKPIRPAIGTESITVGYPS